MKECLWLSYLHSLLPHQLSTSCGTIYFNAYTI